MRRSVLSLGICAGLAACQASDGSSPPTAAGTEQALHAPAAAWQHFLPRWLHHRHPHKPWRDSCSPPPAPSCGWKAYDEGLTGANGWVRFDNRAGAENVVYAASGNQLWQSQDRGETWHAQAILPGRVSALDLPGDDPADVMIGMFSGLAHSADAGKTWSRLALNGLTIDNVQSARSQPLRAYVSVTGMPLFVSDDGGYGWSTAYNYPLGLTVGVSVDPRDAQGVIAAVRYLNSEGGQIEDGAVVRSVDGGAHWTNVFSNQGWVLGVDRCAANPDVLVAAFKSGIARSTDNGLTWSLPSAADAPHGNYGVTLNPSDCDEYYAMPGEVGPRRTRDAGGTFTEPLVEGLQVTKTGSFPGRLSVDPQDRTHLILATHGGFYASHDAGEHWAPIPAMVDLFVSAVAVSPQQPARAWLSSRGSGIWTRDSSSAPWQRVTLDRLPVDNSSRIGVDPYVPGRVFAEANGRLARSIDDGATFSMLPEVQGVTFGFAFDASDPQVIYLATQVNGIYKSVDGGEHFALSNGELQPWWTKVGWTTDMRSIAIDPARPERVFAGSSGQGIFRSDDAGASWQNVLTATDTVQCLVEVNVGGANVLYACLSGLQRSTDGGSTWSDDSAGLTTLSTNNLIQDRQTGTLYTTTGDGVFRKPSAASEWQPIENDCLQGTNGVAIVDDDTGRWLIVGGAGSVRAHAL